MSIDKVIYLTDMVNALEYTYLLVHESHCVILSFFITYFTIERNIIQSFRT